jgi:hypothetical protein
MQVAFINWREIRTISKHGHKAQIKRCSLGKKTYIHIIDLRCVAHRNLNHLPRSPLSDVYAYKFVWEEIQT